MKIHKQGSTAILMRICGAQFKSCYCKEQKIAKALEVTEDVVLRKGIRYIVEHDTVTDENGMADAVMVKIGDYIVITERGARCLSSKEFYDMYSF